MYITAQGALMKGRRDTIRKLYRQGIVEFFGSGDKDIDNYLVKAVKKDVHFGDRAPGQWSPNSVLEIYCESGIPNATDINEFVWEGKYYCSYNSDKWCRIDEYVNLALAGMGKAGSVYHEPYNSAVISIHWSCRR